MNKRQQLTKETHTSKELWMCGMYVRIPMDVNDSPLEGEYRDFRLGQIIEIKSNQAKIQLLKPHDQHRLERLPPVTRPLDLIRRCTIAAQAIIMHDASRKWGRILMPCEPQFTVGEFRRYYVELGDEVQTLCENEIYATYNTQSPDPKQQLLEYEFHPPIWKLTRDNLIENYAALQTVTYGIEDLVGARVMLLPHQAEVISRVLGDKTCRYILADEVGLGKTIEACVILKGLRRRHQRFQTLIIVPNTLIRQWHNELNYKFWLDFITLDRDPPIADTNLNPGVLISHEALEANSVLANWLLEQKWDLIIVDEAHNVQRRPILYERIHALSQQTMRSLVLSATPVQRRAIEYLSLLRLMYPQHYDKVETNDFEQMLATQSTIRNTVAYLTRTLTPNEFDAAEFQTEIASVTETLSHDHVLRDLVGNVIATSRDQGLAAALEAIQYISENYRLENRVIRNRRASLEINLPKRQVILEYAYTPAIQESETLLNLHEYMAGCLAANPQNSRAVNFCQRAFQAAFSSPLALLEIMTLRQNQLEKLPGKAQSQNDINAYPAEIELLERLIWRTKRWQEEIESTLITMPQNALPADLSHRLVQVMRAVYTALRQRGNKVLIFSAWRPTLTYLRSHLIRMYGNQAVAWFRSELDANSLQKEADRLQADDTCRILLSDESGGEGRNFQVATQIIHLDLPWTPAQVEQRIGRVDRLGRSGMVTSIVPYARGTLEEDLFKIWQEAFQLFEQSMSGMEIVLEDIQDQLIEALERSTLTGFGDLLPRMKHSAEQLRSEIEEERYFEEGSVDYRRRAAFAEISNKYRDGERLRKALLGWAEMAGLEHSYDSYTRMVVFDPTRFNLKSIENAKFARPPDMREALRRSGRVHDRLLRGTFDRELAVRREDLIFFAPGELWTDALLSNAMEADRGRCTAVLRYTVELEEERHILALLYRLNIDPRPLYLAGYHPAHLFRAQGYLELPTYCLYVSTDGEIISASSLIGQIIQRPFVKSRDIHLGKRSSQMSDIPPLQSFKQLYSQPEWQSTLNRMFESAEKHICQELTFMVELAEEAREAFARNASGQRAARRWLTASEDVSGADDIREYESVSDCLVEGIAQPIWQLESACFWVLRPAARNG